MTFEGCSARTLQASGGRAAIRAHAVCAMEAPMLFKIALLLLAVWALGRFGVFPAGEWIHALLLAGLALLLLAFLYARDSARRTLTGGGEKR
jgi:hypothetical protein